MITSVHFSLISWLCLGPLIMVMMAWTSKANANELPNLEVYFPNARGQLLAGGRESAGQENFKESLGENIKRFHELMLNGAKINWPSNRIKSSKDNVKLNIKEEIDKLNIDYVKIPNWHQALSNDSNDHSQLGGVSAVDFDNNGNVVIFHRGNHVWEYSSFNSSNFYMKQDRGPIQQNTVLAFNPITGKLVYECGKGVFYMPHGLTVDHENNLWMTDVAMHQVFKFGPCGNDNDRSRRRKQRPLMVLGTAFHPGAGESCFCKPTAVAVLPENGDFFVADGYCNSRILKYSADGKRILSWGRNTFGGGKAYEVAPPNYFAIPHDLTFIPESQLICTADRENGRIQCFHSINGTFHSQYHSPIIGDRIFSVDFTRAQGGQFVVVNGPTGEYGSNPNQYNDVNGYIIDLCKEEAEVVGKLLPIGRGFSNPHDVAMSSDGDMIFVAEINPPVIHKFMRKKKDGNNQTHQLNLKSIATKQQEQLTLEQNTNILSTKDLNSDAEHKIERHHPAGTAVLVAFLMSFFIFMTFALAVFVARRRRRRGNPSTIGGTLSIGQPNELVYRKLVDSNQQLAERQQS